MAETHRHGGDWIAGAHVHGRGGGGVLAQTIRSSGTNGPAPAWWHITLPDDNDVEICGRVTVMPTAGVLEMDPDTAFIFTAPADGSYSMTMEFYKAYTPDGPPVVIPLTVGAEQPARIGTLAATESGADTAALTGAVLAQGVLAATESGADVFTGGSAAPIVIGTLAALESGADIAAFIAQLAAYIPPAPFVSGAQAGGRRRARLQ